MSKELFIERDRRGAQFTVLVGRSCDAETRLHVQVSKVRIRWLLEP
jgi:hypothetical protein